VVYLQDETAWTLSGRSEIASPSSQPTNCGVLRRCRFARGGRKIQHTENHIDEVVYIKQKLCKPSRYSLCQISRKMGVEQNIEEMDTMS
jgi:hypothetical protein